MSLWGRSANSKGKLVANTCRIFCIDLNLDELFAHFSSTAPHPLLGTRNGKALRHRRPAAQPPEDHEADRGGAAEVEPAALGEELVGLHRRPHLDSDRVGDAAEVLDVTTVELAGAVADPYHVRREVVVVGADRARERLGDDVLDGVVSVRKFRHTRDPRVLSRERIVPGVRRELDVLLPKPVEIRVLRLRVLLHDLPLQLHHLERFGQVFQVRGFVNRAFELFVTHPPRLRLGFLPRVLLPIEPLRGVRADKTKKRKTKKLETRRSCRTRRRTTPSTRAFSRK